MNSKRKNISKKIIYGVATVFILLFAAVLCKFIPQGLNLRSVFNYSGISDTPSEILNDDMSVHFLNVGKADCIYIKCKDKNVLIDAADKEPSDTVIEYLKRQGVTKLDLVVASHPHRDHIGQMEEVINEFKISMFLEPNIPDEILPTSVTYERMLRALNAKKIKCHCVRSGDKFNVGEMNMEILGPVRAGKNVNNNSIVMKVVYKSVSFLFTGDAEKSEENDILQEGHNIKSTVLKVAHHGSNTSCGYQFLKEVNPACSVISSGGSKSDLNENAVFKRIKKLGGKIYKTNLLGNIIISTDGSNIKVSTQYQ